MTTDMKTSIGYPYIFPDAYLLRFEDRLADINGGTLTTSTQIQQLENGRSRRNIYTGSEKQEFNVDLDSFPTLTPALTPETELWLTIVYVTLYGLLFLMVYFQLWMIWWYRHKRLSYQTTFLFLCLVWTGLRATLFSFYFNNCVLANDLALVFSWLLYCFPVCLQFATLCLLVLFFAQVIYMYMTSSHQGSDTIYTFVYIEQLIYFNSRLANKQIFRVVVFDNQSNHTYHRLFSILSL